MKHIQGSFLTGYVTILVTGDNPELFFQACVEQGILVWDIKSLSDQSCQGNIKIRHISVIKKARRGTNYKIRFIEKKGYPFILKEFLKRREVLIAFLMSILLIVFLSNILWKVNINGVSKEMEEKIDSELIKYGIHQGSWMFSLESSSAIQQKLINNIPELLWIGVEKKGTTFNLEGVEKTIIEEKEILGPRNLIATKKGIIKHIYVSKGLPRVKVNDYVEQGTILVEGTTHMKEEETSEEEEPLNLVAAEGEVIANTWYEVTVSVDLSESSELLTGNQKKRRFLKIGYFKIPIWGLREPNYESVYKEIKESPLYIFKWQTPLIIVESISSEKVYNDLNRTKEEATKIGIIQAKQELQLKLGPDANVLSEKVLHEAVENGKVILNLYVTVEEDITKADSIRQGE